MTTLIAAGFMVFGAAVPELGWGNTQFARTSAGVPASARSCKGQRRQNTMYVLSALYGVSAPDDVVACHVESIQDVIPWLAAAPGHIAMWTQPNGDVITMRNDNILSIVVQQVDIKPELPTIPAWLLRADHAPCLAALPSSHPAPVVSAMPLAGDVGEILANYPGRMLLGPSRRWAIVPDDGFGRLVGINVYQSRTVNLYRPVPAIDEAEATEQ